MQVQAVARLLATDGPVTGYRRLSGAIPGLGPAFFTRPFRVAGARSSASSPPQPSPPLSGRRRVGYAPVEHPHPLGVRGSHDPSGDP
ncbi:8-oxoguanine DNA glycosylase OGG fold protein [Streptomyces sp. NPDC002308]